MDGILNEDLTTLENVISPFLKQCVGKGKEIPPGNILQVQQITNVSFPTYDKPNYDQEKHTLKITVTDGQSQGYALIPDGCPGINLNTPPGTKIKTTQSIPVQGSLFVLNRNNCEVLGGRVQKLFEKWEQQKKLAIKHEWGYTGSSVEGEGPPPWKPFGYKPSIDVVALRKMKTIDVVSDKKNGQPVAAKTEFDMQREEAISELQATANKQKFQKPNKHLLDKEITDIMEEGFSQSEAEYAMNRFKNTQKALKFLKESKKRQDGAPPEPPKPVFERKDRRKKGKGMDDDEEQEVPAEFQRPTKSISLFGFIEGQIKIDSKPSTQTNGPAQNHGGGRARDLEDGMGRLSIRDSKHDSYSGRGYDRGRGRGHRGGGRGGGGDYHSHNTQRYESNNQRYENNSQHYDSKRGGYSDSGSKRGGYDDNGSKRGGYEDRGSKRGGYEDRGSKRGGYEDTGSKRGGYEDSGSKRGGYEDSGSKRGGYEDSGSKRGGYEDSGSKRGGYDNNAQRYDNNSQQRYESNSQRYDNRRTTEGASQPKSETTARPPRFQNRDERQGDYHSGGPRGQMSGGGGGGRGSSYDNYGDRGESKTSYDTRSYNDNNSRQEYDGNYQSHQQQQQQQQRPSGGKDRSYGSEYHQQQQQQQQQQQYSKSNDYPVPSQSYPPSYQHSQQQRQYAGSQNHESMGHRGGDYQRGPQSHYSNHSGGGGHHQHNPQQQGEFGHYQYGYEGYNPAQSLVFTRSKPDSRGRGGGGYQGNGRGVPAQNNSYGRSNPSNRY